MLSRLRHDTLTSLVATHDASLLVRFGSGRTLTAEADDRPYRALGGRGARGGTDRASGREVVSGVAVFSEPVRWRSASRVGRELKANFTAFDHLAPKHHPHGQGAGLDLAS